MALSPEMVRAIWVFALAIASYFICGIPFGLVIASRMEGIDVRKTGSGNIGMTNVARSAGGKAAALTFLCDVGKGTICVLVGRLLLSAFAATPFALQAVGSEFDWTSGVLFAACIFGHVFSPYLHFKGGKGISVGLGAALGMYWLVGVSALALFLLLTIPTHYVSLGSIAAAIGLPIFSALYGMTLRGMIPVVIACLVVVWSHRENIGRLLRGEESRFSVHHDKDK